MHTTITFVQDANDLQMVSMQLSNIPPPCCGYLLNVVSLTNQLQTLEVRLQPKQKIKLGQKN